MYIINIYQRGIILLLDEIKIIYKYKFEIK